MILCSSLFFSNQLVAQTEPKGLIKTVVIDAGHGGKDPGCHGVKSNEKDITLAVALKVGKYIDELIPDVKVIYTRKKDVFIELDERAAIANRNGADLFISIHCNANTSTVPYGTETYVMGLHKTDANLSVAQRENAVILEEENYAQKYDGFDPNSTEAYIIFSLYQNTNIGHSISLASKIEEQFSERVSRKSRGVHQAGFIVLFKTTMPSVLVETGFLTNREEEMFLNSEQGQDYLASAIFRAVRDYKEEIDARYIKLNSDNEVFKEVVEEEPPQVLTVDSVVRIIPVESKNPVNTEANVKVEQMPPIKQEVYYRVQIGIFKAPFNRATVKNLDDSYVIHLVNYNNTHVKCQVGKFMNIRDAVTAQSKLRNAGFEEAFLVAYKGEDKITVQEAKQILQE